MFRVTLIVEHHIDAEDHEEAEMLFWDAYHNDKNSVKWELVTEEQGNVQE